MPLLDQNGRLFGKLNLFDLFVVLMVVAMVVLGYRWLTVDYRVAPPYTLDSTAVAIEIDLLLPPGREWLCDYVTEGLEEKDPRSGTPRARLRGCRTEDGRTLVQVELNGVRDGSDRILYRGEPLLPGRELRLETEAVLLEGVVRRMTVDGGS